MNYEQKYKEALERAKKQLEDAKIFDYKEGQIAYDIRTTTYAIFPELRESEDERIRKEIISLVDESTALRNVYDLRKMIEWLEKQKEQKPINNIMPSEGMNWLKSLRPQPKNEWSEEDEHRRNDAIYFLETAKTHYADTSELDATISWLKSLQNRGNSLKNNTNSPNEWSEEEEDMLNRCISSIDEAKENRYYYNEIDGDTSYDEEIKWLKSLRPQKQKERNMDEWLEDGKRCYEKGKADALKDLPKWKKMLNGGCGNPFAFTPIYLVKCGGTYNMTKCLGPDDEYIALSELEKLPKE